MTGHQWAAAVILVVGAVINIVACAIGIAFFGAIGAAVATSATNVVWNTAMAIYIHRRVNMVPVCSSRLSEFRRQRRPQIAWECVGCANKMPRSAPSFEGCQ